MQRKSNPQAAKFPPATQILTFLEEASDWLSGEELARRLCVSRAAIAKHVGRLRDEGHVISSMTNRGYYLRIKAEKMARDLIAPHLATCSIGQKGWRFFEETTSTNSEAVAWALDGGPEGAVVTTERQTRGRGRKGHGWFSSPRGLEVSIILHPLGCIDETALVTQKALMAMSEAIQSVLSLSPVIKQPNDLLIDGCKVAGVLVESGRRGDDPDWLVVGIGCNVNALPEDFPKELSGKVTSLYSATGVVISRNLLLAELLSHFENKLKLLLNR